MLPSSLLIKPSGSDCNIDCKYCFYKCRSSEVGQGKQRMSDEVLEKMVKDYLELGLNVSCFAWQGGEPTLMGLDFYKKAVDFQKKYGKDGQAVSNALQTNAILLNDEWCEFLAENKFLVGISIDGPKHIHDYYRKDYAGNGTWDKVMRAIERCKKHGVLFNVLILINDQNVGCPDEIFDFFVEQDIQYWQFIPCVENDPGTNEAASFSVEPVKYGEFMCRIFDRWYEYGPTKISIRLFETLLSFYLRGEHTICTFSRQCADYFVIEHTGDVFVCDFFVDPKWWMGNILETSIRELCDSPVKKDFCHSKQNLCNKCLVCRHLAICRGGCMKDRLGGPDGGFNKASYLCEGYKKFFDHSLGRLAHIASVIKAQQGPQGPGQNM